MSRNSDGGLAHDPFRSMEPSPETVLARGRTKRSSHRSFAPARATRRSNFDKAALVQGERSNRRPAIHLIRRPRTASAACTRTTTLLTEPRARVGGHKPRPALQQRSASAHALEPARDSRGWLRSKRGRRGRHALASRASKSRAVEIRCRHARNMTKWQRVKARITCARRLPDIVRNVSRRGSNSGQT